MSGNVFEEYRVTRGMVQSRRDDTVFVFGDNMERRGYGGQAAVMRGEPNAIGIPTKWAPRNEPDAFFNDEDWQNEKVRESIKLAFVEIEYALKMGKNVILPKDGIGTGLARLDKTAPVIFMYIKSRLDELKSEYS